MNTRSSILKSALLSSALLLPPLALGQVTQPDGTDTQSTKRAELQTELEVARDRLAKAAREMARLQRELVEQGDGIGSWSVKTDGENDENIEIIIEDARNGRILGNTPKLGILLEGGSTELEIIGLSPGGGAEAAGLKRGDRVVAVNGIELDGETTIRDAMGDTEAGNKVEVVVDRDGETKRFEVETSGQGGNLSALAYRFAPHGEVDIDVDIDMEKLHESLSLVELKEGLKDMEREIIVMRGSDSPLRPGAPHAPRFPGLFVLGGNADMVSNHDGLAPYFGTGEGVVVLNIDDDNPLSLQDGDVVLSVDGTTVSRPVDLGRAMLEREPGDTLVLEVMRNGTLTQFEGQVPSSGLNALRRGGPLGMHLPEIRIITDGKSTLRPSSGR